METTQQMWVTAVMWLYRNHGWEKMGPSLEMARTSFPRFTSTTWQGWLLHCVCATQLTAWNMKSSHSRVWWYKRCFTVSCGFPSVFQCGLQRDPTSTKTILSTGSGRFEQYHGRNCQGVSSKSSGSLAKAIHMNNGLSLGGWSLTCEWEKCFHIECLGK